MQSELSLKEYISTPMQAIESSDFAKLDLKVWIKRDDLNHAAIQGNKWHKLKLNLLKAIENNHSPLITFGGAYSNHIAATACAGKKLGIETLGFIRGEELASQPEKWSPTLINAHINGMRFEFLSREAYRNKTTSEFLSQIENMFPNAYIIPEGGSNALAIEGLKPLAEEIQQQCPGWTHLFLPVGTGGTIAGITKYLNPDNHQRIIGVPTALDYRYLEKGINQYLDEQQQHAWEFLPSYFPIRYGSITKEIETYQEYFEKRYQIPLDPIYTARMIAEFYAYLQQEQFPTGSKIILLHTGGIQGNGQRKNTCQ